LLTGEVLATGVEEEVDLELAHHGLNDVKPKGGPMDTELKKGSVLSSGTTTSRAHEGEVGARSWTKKRTLFMLQKQKKMLTLYPQTPENGSNFVDQPRGHHNVGVSRRQTIESWSAVAVLGTEDKW
jgi:hypothetical protein